MHRIHSSIPYDILHGIDFSANLSSMLAYLSYFPPPPPVIPSPPPQRSWTCSARSLSSSSCLIADDLNPPSLRTYTPLINNNQSILTKNASYIDNTMHENTKSSSILDLFENRLPLIVLIIIFLTIFIFVILLLVALLFMQRKRQRQSTSNNRIERFNNNSNTNPSSNTNNKFYRRLIPHSKKYQKEMITLTNTNDDNNLSSLLNHDLPTLEAADLSKTSGIHKNDNEEQEETV